MSQQMDDYGDFVEVPDFNTSSRKSGGNKNSVGAYEDNKSSQLDQQLRIIQCLRDNGPLNFCRIEAITLICRTGISGALGKLSGKLSGPDGERIEIPWIYDTGETRLTFTREDFPATFPNSTITHAQVIAAYSSPWFCSRIAASMSKAISLNKSDLVGGTFKT